MPTTKSSTTSILGKLVLVFFSLIAAGALAAIPARLNSTPKAPQPQAQEPQAPDHHDMSTMDMNDEHSTEGAAVKSMAEQMQHNSHSLHMHMTTMRTQTPADIARANEVVAKLKIGMEKYRDYHVALDDGFKIFLPNFPQPEYHFTSRRNGFLGNFSFDPEKPTSLLYKKTATGYDLVGAMYTMPRRASEDQLNERVPLSIAMWHQHTNLCFPPFLQAKHADYTKYGLTGTIATQEACDAANGHFFPVVLGWMVHVYPYEDTLAKQFPMHDMH